MILNLGMITIAIGGNKCIHCWKPVKELHFVICKSCLDSKGASNVG